MSTIPAPTQGIAATGFNPSPRTRTIAELVYETTAERVNRATALAGEITDLHGAIVSDHLRATQRTLDSDAQVLSTLSAVELLDELASGGLAWRQIAALVGVSVPAVRKWRQGGSVSGLNRLRLARRVALFRWLSNDRLIGDPASWLEVPLVAFAPVSRLDLLVADRDDLVISSLIGPETAPEQILDEYDPSWRDRSETDYEVFTADDGGRSIRFRHDRR